MKIFNTTSGTISVTQRDGTSLSFPTGASDVNYDSMDDATWQQLIYTGKLKLVDKNDATITPDVDVATTNLKGFARSVIDDVSPPKTGPITYNISSSAGPFIISMFRYGSGTTGWYGFSETILSNVSPFIVPMDCVVTNLTYVSQNVATSMVVVYVIPFNSKTQSVKFKWDLRQTRSACINKQFNLTKGDKVAIFSDSSGNGALLSPTFPTASVPTNPWVNITCQPTSTSTDFLDAFSGNFV
jgi:hypothetical protein